jgi:hypothetical protein
MAMRARWAVSELLSGCWSAAAGGGRTRGGSRNCCASAAVYLPEAIDDRCYACNRSVGVSNHAGPQGFQGRFLASTGTRALKAWPSERALRLCEVFVRRARHDFVATNGLEV